MPRSRDQVGGSTGVKGASGQAPARTGSGAEEQAGRDRQRGGLERQRTGERSASERQRHLQRAAHRARRGSSPAPAARRASRLRSPTGPPPTRHALRRSPGCRGRARASADRCPRSRHRRRRRSWLAALSRGLPRRIGQRHARDGPPALTVRPLPATAPSKARSSVSGGARHRHRRDSQLAQHAARCRRRRHAASAAGQAGGSAGEPVPFAFRSRCVVGEAAGDRDRG